jgi:hypothetical protein
MMQFLCKFASSTVALAKAGRVHQSFQPSLKLRLAWSKGGAVSLNQQLTQLNFNNLIKNYVSNNTGSVNYRRNS